MSHSGLGQVGVGEGGGAWRVQRCTGNASVGSTVTLWVCWTVDPGALGMESSQLVQDPEIIHNEMLFFSFKNELVPMTPPPFRI